jgi:hypothetical protein
MTQRQQFESFYIGLCFSKSLYGHEYRFQQFLEYMQDYRDGEGYSNTDIEIEWRKFKLVYRETK